MALVFALLVCVVGLTGIVAGLRTVTGLATVSWAAWLGAIDVSGTPWLAWLGYQWTPWIVSALALAEFVADKLPTTPSRKVPMQFGARLLVGAIAGAAIGWPQGHLVLGIVSGLIGATIGTLGGAAARARLAAAFGKDRPAALIEDLVAIVGAAGIVAYLA